MWWIAGGFLVLVLLFLWQLFGPSPRIVVSRQTTYITAPLKPNGLPDYGKYLLDKSREGVTPENNAAVLLWQALWPGELDPQHYALMADALGLEEIPTGEESLQPFRGDQNRGRILAWLRSSDAMAAANDGQPAPDASYETDWDRERIGVIFNQTPARPWTSAEFPPLAEWVAENNGPLDMVVEASRRPRYWSPWPELLDGSDTSLYDATVPDLEGMREAGRALAVRAMWNLGEGRPAEAWDDLQAIYRLGRLAAQGPTLIDQFIAWGLYGIAWDGTATLVGSKTLNEREARTIQHDLEEVTPFNSIVNAMDVAERVASLDATLHMRSGDPLEDDLVERTALKHGLDWNVVLREYNRWYDRFIAAAQLPDHSARAEAVARLTNELAQLDSRLDGPIDAFGVMLSRRARSQLIANMLVSLLLPAVESAVNAEDYANTQLEIIRLAAALAVYRAEHGTYPEKLADVVPEVLPTLPVDPYHAKPFVYQRDGAGYLLYSPGPNGGDDGGSNIDRHIVAGQEIDGLPEDEYEKLCEQLSADAGADDVSIRVPRPPLALPTH